MASMHHPAESDQIAASRDDEVVLGVDTHKDLHVAAVLTPVGALLASATFPTTADGYAHLLAWACTSPRTSVTPPTTQSPSPVPTGRSRRRQLRNPPPPRARTPQPRCQGRGLPRQAQQARIPGSR